MNEGPVAISVRSREGVVHAVRAATGLSLMEALRNAGIEEMFALCGGFCACGTCHVFLSPEIFEAVGGPGAGENELLGDHPDRRPTSRLSCQVEITAAFDAAVIEIAPEA